MENMIIYLKMNSNKRMLLFKNKYKVLLLIHACQGRYVGHGHPLFQAQSYKKLNKLPNNDEGFLFCLMIF